MAENGRASTSNRTKKINICYFFIKERVDNDEVTVVHCPTDEMTGDYFTKPLQGDKFRKFRYQIMGLPDEENYP